MEPEIKGLAEALQKAETLADKVYWILIYEGQYNHKFHIGETIMNNPAEVRDLIEKYSDILNEEREKKKKTERSMKQMAKLPDGHVFIYKPKRTKIEIEEHELVMCRNCKHRDPEDHKCDCGHAIQWQLPREDNWFCADGERKVGE